MKRLFSLGLCFLMAVMLSIPAAAQSICDGEFESEPITDLDTTGVARVMGTGTVTGNNVNVRTGPSTDYPVITQANKGDRVGVQYFRPDENSSDPDDIWFYCILSKTGQKGYIFWQYVQLDPYEI